MLNAALLVVGISLGDVAPTTARPVENLVEMSDTLPSGNRFRIPFTREEFVRAMLQVMSRERAEERARTLYDDPQPNLLGVHLADGDLLVIALLSDDLTVRVLAYRPALRGMIEDIRGRRDEFLAEWRSVLARDSVN